MDGISIHALCEEGDLDGRTISSSITISIHALCEEGDCAKARGLAIRSDFYPRPLRGGRLHAYDHAPTTFEFLSTPSARRATRAIACCYRLQEISIHALCEEGDIVRALLYRCINHFYPRPLRGGRRKSWRHWTSCSRNFYPRPLRGGRRLLIAPTRCLCNFYPRPLRGGRLAQVQRGGPRRPISIHALCEEGDLSTPGARLLMCDFYPRPLRGGRPVVGLFL